MDTIVENVSRYKQYLKDLQYMADDFVVSFILCGFIHFMVFYWWFYRRNEKYKLPPGPLGVPILGYLPFLSKEPFRDFDRLSRKYGNVFSFYLGQSRVVILGNYDAVKEVFSKSITTDRPEKLFDFIPDGIGFSSVNGEEWVEQRNYSVKAMRNLGLGRDQWENLVKDEVDDFINLIYKHEGKQFDFRRLLTTSVCNNIASFVFGKRFPLTEENENFFNGILESFYTFTSQTGWRHYFPSFYDLMSKVGISSHSATYKEFEDFNNFVRKEVELRKQAYIPGSTDNYIDGYLTEIKNNEEQHLGNTFTEKNLRGNVQAIFMGGSDTTRTSLSWLLLCMATYLDIQENVQKELDSVLGKIGKIKWSERSLVPYTFAVIMEGQRWRTVAPLNTSRVAMEDFQIGGYDIPKGTTIIANNWGLHHDTKYWKEPDKFMPERFLLEDGTKVNYKPESYVPFSYGKRNCPAETIGMMEILFYFTAILQNFKVLPPKHEVPQLDGTIGLTFQTIPQKLCFVPRRK